MSPVYAASNITRALDKAAEYFVKSAVRIDSGKKLIISEVVNYNSKKFDALGKKIQNELYFAIERQWPDYKLYVGAPEPDQVCIQGSYEKQAHEVVIRLQAFSGCGKPEILGQVTVRYKESKKRRKTLVAVLDIESNELNAMQVRGFSEIFRSELDRIDEFDIASSADVYKFDPEAVQKATGCTRDECANIIGEQMGVDRVISSSLFKITDNQYILSGKMLNIQTGEIVVSRTVDHNGSLGTFKRALQKLARQLTDQEEADDEIRVNKSPVFKATQPESKTKEAEIIEEPEDPNAESWASKNVWHITAISGMTLGMYGMYDNAQAYNDLASKNNQLKIDYQNASSQTEADQIAQKISDNEEIMASKKNDYEQAQMIFFAAAIWETYLYFWSDDEPVETSSYEVPNTFKLAITTKSEYYAPGIKATWRW